MPTPAPSPTAAARAGDRCAGAGTCQRGVCGPSPSLTCFDHIRCVCGRGLTCADAAVPGNISATFDAACTLIGTAQDTVVDPSLRPGKRLKRAHATVRAFGKRLGKVVAATRRARKRNASEAISTSCANELKAQIAAVKQLARELGTALPSCAVGGAVRPR